MGNEVLTTLGIIAYSTIIVRYLLELYLMWLNHKKNDEKKD